MQKNSYFQILKVNNIQRNFIIQYQVQIFYSNQKFRYLTILQQFQKSSYNSLKQFNFSHSFYDNLMILSNYHLSNLTQMITILISILLKNSAQIFVSNYIQSKEINFIFGIIEFPKMFKIMVISVNLVCLIISTVKLIIFKKQTFYFQFYQFLLSPILIYLISQLLRKSIKQDNQIQIIIWSICLMLKCMILLLISIQLNIKFKNNNFQTINNINSYHITLVNVQFIFMAIFPFSGLSPFIGIVVLMCLNVIKSLVILMRINYENPFIEYCSVLNEISSWNEFICLVLSIYFRSNSGYIMWLNGIFMIYLIINKNRVVLMLIQNKYLFSVKKIKSIILSSMNMSQYNKVMIQQRQLIQIFICMIYLVKRRTNIGINNNDNSYRRRQNIQQNEKIQINVIRLSQSLCSQILQLSDLMSNISTGFNNEQSNRYRVIQSCNNFKQSTLQIKWGLIWKIVSRLDQIQLPQYNKLRTFLINQFPRLNTIYNYKLLHLHYINIKHQNNKSFWYQLEFQLNYKYLTQKIFFQHSNALNNHHQRKFVSSKIKQQQTFIIANDKINGVQVQNYFQKIKLCTTYSNSVNPQSSSFDIYFQQTFIQRNIQQSFIQAIQIQQQIIALIKIKQNKLQLLELLTQKNYHKSNIIQSIKIIETISQLKFIIYNFILQYFIYNTPNIAINNLKQLKFQDFIHDRNKMFSHNNTKSTTLINIKTQTQLNIQEKSQNSIAFISKTNAFGRIVHCCSNFRRKMEIRNPLGWEDSQNFVQKTTIYDIMLPLWADKHINQTNKGAAFETPSCHRGKKFHLISLIQKNIYEVNFEIHYILRNMNDLLLALDIKSIQVDKLCVYNKKQQKVFQSLSNRYTASRIKTMKHKKYQDEQTKFQPNQKYVKHRELIFGQQYQILCTYRKGQNINNSSRLAQTVNGLSKQPSISLSKVRQLHVNPQLNNVPSQTSHHISSLTMTSGAINSPIINEKLINQIKMKQYIENTLFHQGKLFFFTAIHWSIPPFILTVSLLLRYYASQKQFINNNLFQTQLTIHKNFLMVDTHLLNTLYCLNQLKMHLSPQQLINSQILQIIVQDIQFNQQILFKRQYLLNKIMTNQSPVIDFMFINNPSLNNTQSFYFSALNYDLQVEDYFKLIGYQQSVKNTTLNIQNLFTSSNSTPISIQRFFKRFSHRYQEYFYQDQFNAIATKIKNYQLQTFQSSKSVFSFLIICLGLIAFFPAVQFVLAYVDLIFQVQKLVLTCLDFSQKQIKTITAKLTQTRQLIQNCRQTFPSRVISKYNKGSSHDSQYYFDYNENQSSHINLGKHSLKQKQIFYESKCQVTAKVVPIIILFACIVGLCQILLVLLIAGLSSQIKLIQKYSEGLRNMTNIAALSNQISNEILFAKDDPNRDDYLESCIYEYWRNDKLNLIRDIQPDQNIYSQTVFYNACSINKYGTNQTICPQTTPMIGMSYSESISWNLMSFKALFNHLQESKQTHIPVQFSKINSHSVKIIKGLSVINRFVHELTNLGLQNFQYEKQDPTVYFDALILQMAAIIISFNWFTYVKVYKKMKIYYEQAFSMSPYDDMNRLQQFHFYCNQAQQYKITFTSGKYELHN